MQFSLAFQPLVPLWLLAALGGAALLVATLLLAVGRRGALARLIGTALIVLALAGPSLVREDRAPLTSVAAVVVDRSASQKLGNRAAETEAALAIVKERLAGLANIETRIIEAGESTGDDGTQLFSALQKGLADVPPDRVAGAILITDGRVHDLPANARALGFEAPLHALITGRANDRDRRVVALSTPRFGIVGQAPPIRIRVDQAGPGAPERIPLTVRRDGETIDNRTVMAGEEIELSVPVTHPGQNIVEIEAAAGPGELTLANNRMVLPIEGIREKLRVLLVSGEPNAGERTWRNLLKSDTSVELVHFTILRPPEKQDGTPIQELSLIAFPTRELFQLKIKEFDLIIFDRYARQSILPAPYFENIARYVRDGGAVLVASGADYATPTSLYSTPLDQILPAAPTGRVSEAPFHARLSDPGKRHPVTRDLPGANAEPPRWSRFFRIVETRPTRDSNMLMQGPEEKPLLLLSRIDQGRVALMLSDHIWLWARGYEGGGPHLELLRRLSHWLMKVPALEEEAVRLTVRGASLVVERQTMSDAPEPVTLTGPDGAERVATLEKKEDGLWQAVIDQPSLGLWRAASGRLTALVHVGPPNPREFTEVTSTTDLLKPIATETNGSVFRIADSDAAARDPLVPRILQMRQADSYFGSDWLAVRQRQATVVTGIGALPLLAGGLGLLFLLAGIAATWVREGR